MKTLQDIKDEYAQEQGYEDWRELRKFQQDYNNLYFERDMNEICLRAQKAALKNAAENTEDLKYIDVGGYRILDTTSIINEQNLIR